jgi:hypothetical protein
MHDHAEQMKACRVAGRCRADFPAQVFRLGEAPGLKMPDRCGKLFGSSGWCLGCARRLRTPQAKLPARHKASPSERIDLINSAINRRARSFSVRRACPVSSENQKNEPKKTGPLCEPVFRRRRIGGCAQKSKVKPVVTALSVAPPIVSLAASRLQT